MCRVRSARRSRANCPTTRDVPDRSTPGCRCCWTLIRTIRSRWGFSIRRAPDLERHRAQQPSASSLRPGRGRIGMKLSDRLAAAAQPDESTNPRRRPSSRQLAPAAQAIPRVEQLRPRPRNRQRRRTSRSRSRPTATPSHRPCSRPGRRRVRRARVGDHRRAEAADRPSYRVPAVVGHRDRGRDPVITARSARGVPDQEARRMI